MSSKTSNRISFLAVITAIAVPVGQKALDSSQKIIESRFVAVKAEAKDESDFKDLVILNLIERVSELESKLKEITKK